MMHEAIEQKHQEAKALLEEAAMTDQLTSLPNRRKLMERSEFEFARIQRTQVPMWLLLIDLDYFKKINDTAGHLIGDKVLVAVGKVIKDTTRTTDITGRFGGEEFAIILTDTTKEGALRVSETLLERIAAMDVIGWTDTHGTITASIGIASSQGVASLNQLFDNADKALYRSKSKGRNCAVFAELS